MNAPLHHRGPAPFTPATLAEMRALAKTCGVSEIARHLGWDEARLLGVARAHGIALIAPRRNDDDALAVGIPIKRRSASASELLAMLPDRTGTLFALLLHASDFMTGQVLQERLGLSKRKVENTVLRLRDQLADTSFQIVASPQHGYRLIERDRR